MVSGDLRAAVGMLEVLDQKTSQNASMSKEKANAFMKVGVKTDKTATLFFKFIYVIKDIELVSRL